MARGTPFESLAEPLLKSKTNEVMRSLNEWKDQLPGADLQVFYPLRGDFDHEHDNAAEEVCMCVCA